MPQSTTQETTTTQIVPSEGSSSPAEKIVESASATTSTTANASSGHSAYVITAIVLAILCGITFAGGRIISVFVSTTLDESTLTSIIDRIDGYVDDGYVDDSTTSASSAARTTGISFSDGAAGRSASFTMESALAQNLHLTGDGGITVAATSYSGAQQAVSTYVSSLVSADKRANSTVLSHLRVARGASSDSERTKELVAAAQAATAAKTELAAIAVPEGLSSSVSSSLATARSSALSRWDDVLQEIGVILSPDAHNMGDLADVDDELASFTELSSTSFETALESSAATR